MMLGVKQRRLSMILEKVDILQRTFKKAQSRVAEI
jgi:hypothetical protein